MNYYMIHRVLPIVVAELNGFLMRAVADTEDRVVLSALVDQAGDIAFKEENRVICTLTGVEQERTNLNQMRSRTVVTNPPVYLNLYLLFSSYFKNYDEALKFLSLVIAFFQGKQVFTPQNTPGLPDGMEKITIEINNLDQHQQNQLWSAIGAKMMPSVSMKLRMVAITRDQILGEIPEIRGIDTTTSPNS